MLPRIIKFMKTLKELHLKENERVALDEAAHVLRGNFPVSKILLFGSKATGSDDPESDIDILVLTSRELPWRERDGLINALFETQLIYDVVFGVLVVSENEWKEGLSTVLPIHHEIEEHGVAV